MKNGSTWKLKNVMILANPASGQSDVLDVVGKVVILLGLEGVNAEYKVTKSAEDMIRTASAYANTGSYDAIIASGGDGTLRDVLSSVVNTDVPVAVLPTGTGNVFASEMGIPSKPSKWVKTFMKSVLCSVDGGVVNGKYFLMMCGAGFDAHTVKETEKLGIKRYFGRFSYIIGLLKSFAVYDYPPMQIVIDDKINDSGYGVIVSNTSRYGVFFSLTPGALCTDGYLDCLVYRRRGFSGIFELFLTAYFAFAGAGKRIKYKGNIRRYKCKKISVTSEESIPVHIDGDVCGTLPAEISVIKNPFLMLLPYKTVKYLIRKSKKVSKR